VPVEEYLATFKWDGVHFQQDKNLEYLGHFIQKSVKSSEEKVKQQTEKMQGLKNHMSSLTKKKGNNLTQCDLSDYVYDNGRKIRPDVFVNTHYAPEVTNPAMTTVLVVVNKTKEQAFKDSY